jgi:hypothetical protein
MPTLYFNGKPYEVSGEGTIDFSGGGVPSSTASQPTSTTTNTPAPGTWAGGIAIAPQGNIGRQFANPLNQDQTTWTHSVFNNTGFTPNQTIARMQGYGGNFGAGSNGEHEQWLAAHPEDWNIENQLLQRYYGNAKDSNSFNDMGKWSPGALNFDQWSNRYDGDMKRNNLEHWDAYMRGFNGSGTTANQGAGTTPMNQYNEQDYGAIRKDYMTGDNPQMSGGIMDILTRRNKRNNAWGNGLNTWGGDAGAGGGAGGGGGGGGVGSGGAGGVGAF